MSKSYHEVLEALEIVIAERAEKSPAEPMLVVGQSAERRKQIIDNIAGKIGLWIRDQIGEDLSGPSGYIPGNAALIIRDQYQYQYQSVDGFSEILLAQAVLQGAQVVNAEYAAPVCQELYGGQIHKIIDKMRTIR